LLFLFLKCFVSFQACASKFVKVHNFLLFFLFNNIPPFLNPRIIWTKIIHFLFLSAQFPSRSPHQAEACGSQDACRESWRPWDGVACHCWTRLLGCGFSSLCCLCSYLLDQDMWGSNRPLNTRWTYFKPNIFYYIIVILQRGNYPQDFLTNFYYHNNVWVN
jgi:hypothetical protein